MTPHHTPLATIPAALLLILATLLPLPWLPAVLAQESGGENEPSALSFTRYPSYFGPRNPLTPQSPVLLRFNAPVDPERAGQFIVFADGEGEERIGIDAKVPDRAELRAFYPHLGDEAVGELVTANHLQIRPARPLPLDKEWNLVLHKGLASTDRAHTLQENETSRLGHLHSFRITSAVSQNPFDGEKHLLVRHNKGALDPALDNTDLANFVQVAPRPEGYELDIRGNAIRIDGDFALHTGYTVTVHPGLRGNDTTVLGETFTEEVSFAPNDGFVSLPAFSTTQNASGHRKFELRTGNLSSLDVKVKRVEGENLVRVLKGYDESYEGHGGDRAIPFAMVAGETVHEESVEPTAGTDRTETFEFGWDQLGGGKKFGAYYFCAEGDSRPPARKSVGAQSIVQLTDIGLAWKQNEEETLVHTFSLSTGSPLEGVDLEIFSDEVHSLARARTGPGGIARIPATGYGEDGRWLDARLGDDRHVKAFDRDMHGTPLWSFGIDYRYDEPLEDERRSFLFTDRGVYRPGDEVHLKALSRFAGSDAIRPGGGGKARLRVLDHRNRKLLEREVELGERGSLDESFAIPESGGLGWYTAELDFNPPEEDDGENPRNHNRWRHVFRHSFQVEEYRVNTFEIDLAAEDEYQQGASIGIPLSARYYLGKPLSKSLLSWNARSTTAYPRPRGFENFHFGDRSEPHSYRPRGDDAYQHSEEQHLGKDGTAELRIELPEQKGLPSPREISVHAEVTDANQQTISRSTRFTVHSSDFYLGIRPPEGTHRAGETAAFSFAGVTSGGEVHAAPVEAFLKVEKEIHTTVKIVGAEGRATHRTERRLLPVSEERFTLETDIEPETGLARTHSHELVFEEAGEYLLTLEAEDERGRPVVTKSRFRVIGMEEPAWSWHDVVRIDVIPDKANYQQGDTAKVLVRSPVFGHTLVTTERGGVRHVETRTIDRHETVIDVPLGEGDAPNVFVSVLVVRGSDDSPHKHPHADYRLGYCQLEVEDPGAALDLSIDTGRDDSYRPGEEATVRATVRTSAGEPLPGAEVTLYAVDEGVLSLTGYETPDPGGTFHAPFPLNVSTGQSLSELLPENPREREFGNKGYVIGGGGLVDGLDPDRLRKDFKALAFWEGALLADETGTVSAAFTVPDNLTTFRIIAVAAEGTRFGNAEADLVVNKPLVIEPALPRFSNLADQIDLSAVLHNNTDRAQRVEVEVLLDEHATFLEEVGATAPTSLGPDQREGRRAERLTLAPGATETLRFPVGMTDTGEAVWNWKVRSLDDPKLNDATESRLDIGFPQPLLREHHNVTIRNQRELRDLLSQFNPRLRKGRGDISVTLSNSRLVEASDALDYLLKYPYGCVEQTTSSLLPWLSTQRVRGALPGLDKSEEEIAGTVSKGVKRLLSMQTSDGGLGYWPGARESVLWGSAYGGMALALAGKNGAEVPEEPANALWAYLSKQLRDSAKTKDPYELSQRCLAAYTLALAGRPEPGYHEVLFEAGDRLPEEARSLLALAMMESGALEKDGLRPRVENLLAPPDPDRVLPESGVSWYGRPYRAATRLLAEARLDPAGELADQLVDDLMKLRLPERGWGSTYSNAWPLLALTAHSDANAAALAGNEITLSFHGKSETIDLDDTPSSGTARFAFDGDATGENLALSLRDQATIHASVEVSTRPELLPLEPENKGFGIRRSYRKVDTDGSVGPADDLMVGDLVLVRLDLNLPREKATYLAIDDPLPAIFEAVNPDFATQGGQAGRDAGNGTGDAVPRLYTHYRELREDRALFFADYVFRSGDYRVEYLARVVAPGQVTAPPAKIEAMYEPQKFGLSGTEIIAARPLDLGEDKVAAAQTSGSD